MIDKFSFQGYYPEIPYNDKLKSPCDAYEIYYIDNYGNFLLASDNIYVPDSKFMRDKIHLNSFGLQYQ